jgi:hypothetical protein
VAGNDACIPGGDTVVRSCLRLVELSATDTGASRLQDFDVAHLAAYVYFPAVTTDLTGNLFVSFSGSSATLTPSVEALSLPIDGTTPSGLLVARGRGPYDSTATACHGGLNRWGDYSGAATDPSNPNDVWIASEFAASPTNSCAWGTAIARLTLAAPTASSMAPVTGPSRGGTTVTITGGEFGIAGTSVWFAGIQASSVSVDSSEQLRAVSPPHLGCGSVAVVVSTANGTSLPMTFNYAGRPCAASQSTGVRFPARLPPPPVR